MRPNQNQKNRPRGRGRHGGGGGGGGSGGGGGGNQGHSKPQNLLGRTMDSNGPDVKIRGTPAHIYEKYLQLARDAHSSGDRVVAENYLQHAEHYYRLIMAAQAQMPQHAPNGNGYRGPNGHGTQNGQQPPVGTEPQPIIAGEQAQPADEPDDDDSRSSIDDR